MDQRFNKKCLYEQKYCRLGDWYRCSIMWKHWIAIEVKSGLKRFNMEQYIDKVTNFDAYKYFCWNKICRKAAINKDKNEKPLYTA